MRTHPLRIVIILISLFYSGNLVQAQFEINGQFIQRGEYRHGYGRLIPDSLKPANFVSQRARIQFTYNLKNVEFYTSVQDIRTWGSTSQTNISDAFLSVHEAWAQIGVDSFLKFKLGRQELNYDNSRFMGNLDWALQARAHDFALLKYERKRHKFHLGGGYNQSTEGFWGNAFTTPNQYKTAHMVWYNYKSPKSELSFLFWNNGKQFLQTDSLGNYIVNKTRYMQTIGLPMLKTLLGKNTTLSAFAYYQFGKDVANREVSAFDLSGQISQLFSLNEEKGSSLRTTLGIEVLSGKSTLSNSNRNTSFSPLYGTNHAHNGYMDFFYVGGRHENSTGLADIFLRIKYQRNKKLFIATDLHYFTTQAAIYKGGMQLSNTLGTEIDCTAGYRVNEILSIQLGYSHFLAGESFKVNQANGLSNTQNWLYLMLIIRPRNTVQFIGLLH